MLEDIFFMKPLFDDLLLLLLDAQFPQFIPYTFQMLQFMLILMFNLFYFYITFIFLLLCLIYISIIIPYLANISLKVFDVLHVILHLNLIYLHAP